MQGRWTNGLLAMRGGDPTQKKETFSGLFFEEFKERLEYKNMRMVRCREKQDTSRIHLVRSWEKTRYFSHSSGEKSRKNKILLAFIKNKELLHEAVITGNFYLFQYQSDSSCRRGGWTCRCANIPIAAKPANRRWHSCACLNGKSQPPMVRMRLIALRSTRRTSSSLCPRSATHALSVW